MTHNPLEWKRRKPGLYVAAGARATVRRRRDGKWEWKVWPLRSWSKEKYKTMAEAMKAADTQAHHVDEEE